MVKQKLEFVSSPVLCAWSSVKQPWKVFCQETRSWLKLSVELSAWTVVAIIEKDL